MRMDEEATSDDDRVGPLSAELRKKTKDDPEFTEQMEAARRVMEEYSETLQRLADS